MLDDFIQDYISKYTDPLIFKINVAENSKNGLTGVLYDVFKAIHLTPNMSDLYIYLYEEKNKSDFFDKILLQKLFNLNLENYNSTDSNIRKYGINGIPLFVSIGFSNNFRGIFMLQSIPLKYNIENDISLTEALIKHEAENIL